MKVVLINMVTILIMSVKLATGYSGTFHNTGILNEGYDVIIPIHDFINKILSRDSNYIVDVVMRPKVGNSSICMRKVIRI